MLYMNLHIGDWLSGTVLCSALERGVYIDLLVAYYAKGRPLMRSECDRIARAYTTEEREAMRYVLEQFFTEKDGEFHNSRADKEIANSQHKSETNRANGIKRWEKEKQGDAGDSGSDVTRETDANAYANACANDHAKKGVTRNPKPETESSSVGAVESSPAPQQAAIDLPEPVQPKAAKKPAAGSTKKVHLAEAFSTLPDEWRKYCATTRPDLDAERVFAAFSFYWTSGKGAATLRTARSWTTSWQKWLANENATEANRARPKEKTPEERRAYQKQIAQMYGYPEKYAAAGAENRYRGIEGDLAALNAITATATEEMPE